MKSKNFMVFIGILVLEFCLPKGKRGSKSPETFCGQLL